MPRKMATGTPNICGIDYLTQVWVPQSYHHRSFFRRKHTKDIVAFQVFHEHKRAELKHLQQTQNPSPLGRIRKDQYAMSGRENIGYARRRDESRYL